MIRVTEPSLGGGVPAAAAGTYSPTAEASFAESPAERPALEIQSEVASPALDPLIGTVINRRFHIVRAIARGGMGKVYLAEQAPLGRPCAVKVLNPRYEGDRDPGFHRRFYLEAATLSRLTHPNTVTVFDYGLSETDPTLYYIAMEYIEGQTLHRVVRSEGAMPAWRAISIALQVCGSLHEAHSIGVVHRDLKPGNILLTRRAEQDDFVKVLDFGLVKDLKGDPGEEQTQFGLFMGSPKYMSPEQITGATVSPATDVYALGVILYELLSGKVPFDRGASMKTLLAHVNDEPPPLRTSHYPALSISEALREIVTRCLEKDPNKRYQSMEDLACTLREVPEYLEAPANHSKRGLSIPPVAVDPSALAHSLSPSMGADTVVVARRPSRLSAAALGLFFLFLMTGTFVALKSRFSPAHPEASLVPQVSSPVVPPPEKPRANALPDTAPATPEPRLLHVESVPPGARVFEGETELCGKTPCDIRFADESHEKTKKHVLLLKKPGFHHVAVTSESASLENGIEILSVELAPRPPSTPRAVPAAPDDSSPRLSNYKPSPY